MRRALWPLALAAWLFACLAAGFAWLMRTLDEASRLGAA